MTKWTVEEIKERAPQLRAALANTPTHPALACRVAQIDFMTRNTMHFAGSNYHRYGFFRDIEGEWIPPTGQPPYGESSAMPYLKEPKVESGAVFNRDNMDATLALYDRRKIGNESLTTLMEMAYDQIFKVPTTTDYLSTERTRQDREHVQYEKIQALLDGAAPEDMTVYHCLRALIGGAGSHKWDMMKSSYLLGATGGTALLNAIGGYEAMYILRDICLAEPAMAATPERGLTYSHNGGMPVKKKNGGWLRRVWDDDSESLKGHLVRRLCRYDARSGRRIDTDLFIDTQFMLKQMCVPTVFSYNAVKKATDGHLSHLKDWAWQRVEIAGHTDAAQVDALLNHFNPAGHPINNLPKPTTTLSRQAVKLLDSMMGGSANTAIISTRFNKLWFNTNVSYSDMRERMPKINGKFFRGSHAARLKEYGTYDYWCELMYILLHVSREQRNPLHRELGPDPIYSDVKENS